MKKRSGQIKNKVFSLSDITRIAKLIDAYKHQLIAVADEQDKRFVRSVFVIECADNSTNEFENIDFLEKDDFNGFGRILAIKISLSSYETRHYIRISLDSERGYGLLDVEGRDMDWVDAKFSQLIKAIDLVKPQENWYIKNQLLVMNIAAISIGIIPWFLVSTFLDLIITPIENPSEKIIVIREFFNQIPWLEFIFPLLGCWGFGLVWAQLLNNWVTKLWPSIEFDFGPDHLNVIKERRKRIKIAGTVVIMPVLLAIIKAVVNKYL